MAVNRVFAFYTEPINTAGTTSLPVGVQMERQVVLRDMYGAAVTPPTPYSKNDVWNGKDDLAAGDSGKRFVPQGAEKLGITFSGRSQTGSSTPTIEWSADGTTWGGSETFTALTTSNSSQYKVVDVKGRYYRIVTPNQLRGVSVNVSPIPDSNY